MMDQTLESGKNNVELVHVVIVTLIALTRTHY